MLLRQVVTSAIVALSLFVLHSHPLSLRHVCLALTVKVPSQRLRHARPVRYRPLRQRSQDPLAVERNIIQSYHHHNNNNNNNVNNTRVFVMGSDESGAGAIAGPLVAASCVVLSPLTDAYCPLAGVDDCKRLSAVERERAYQHVTSRPDLYAYTVVVRWPSSLCHAIDGTEHTIHNITLCALRESILKLASELPEYHSLYSIVDGHLSPNLEFYNYNNNNNNNNNNNTVSPFPTRPWLRGDEMVYTVALASILARVVRDTLVAWLATRHAAYGFDQHGGYATRQHVHALHQYGALEHVHWPCVPVQRVTTRSPLSRHKFWSAAVASGGGVLTAVLMAQNDKHILPPAHAVTIDARRGISYPDVGEIAAAVPTDWRIIDSPFDDPSLFRRLDTFDDDQFYQSPRYVEHVDEAAVRILTNYMNHLLVTITVNHPTSAPAAVLDLCSSWTSHISPHDATNKLLRVAGLGMNAQELAANPSLTDWTVQDLNTNPVLPYPDNSFDAVVCQLSIEYLTRPLQVCCEISRVLRTNGTVHILFSNRLFLSKAVALWTGADDVDHVFTVAAYLYFCHAGFTKIEAVDLSTRKGREKRIVGDPMYVVRATKMTT